MKIVRIWSKMSNIQSFLTIFDQNQLFQWDNRHLDGLFYLLIEIDRKWSILIEKKIEIDQTTIIKIWSHLDRNCNRRLEFIVGFRIERKSTIDFGQLGIRIVDDSILEA